MKIWVLLLVAVFCLLGCQTTPAESATPEQELSYAGGDGTSVEKAVVILGAMGSMDGVPAEYAWIQRNLPGAKIESQSIEPGEKTYDLFKVTLPNGETRDVYFDISSFFGKDW